MFNKELILNILQQIEYAIDRILATSETVKIPDDYATSTTGMERLESTCMLLTAIGESVKNLDKRTEKKYLTTYKSIEWKKIMGMRDIIVHHYFDIDIEMVFDIVKNKIPDLKEVISQMVKDLRTKDLA
jgi:uncharacterized protein with HEPN domain